jgi:hypothetical protein
VAWVFTVLLAISNLMAMYCIGLFVVVYTCVANGFNMSGF